MLNRERVIDILCQRVLIHIEDPTVSDLWEELTQLLSVDVCQTIDFLNTCSKEELYFVSEVFDDIAINLQSQKFIDTLYTLDKKFPDLEIRKDIKDIEQGWTSQEGEIGNNGIK